MATPPTTDELVQDFHELLERIGNEVTQAVVDPWAESLQERSFALETKLKLEFKLLHEALDELQESQRRQSQTWETISYNNQTLAKSLQEQQKSLILQQRALSIMWLLFILLLVFQLGALFLLLYR